MKQSQPKQSLLQASVELAGDAFNGLVHTVEGVHQSIVSGIATVLPPARGVGWVSSFIYARVRDVGWLGFASASQAAGLAEALRPGAARDVPQRTRMGLQAALNGAFGDHLETRGNGLGFNMGLCVNGKPIALTAHSLKKHLRKPQPNLVIMLHGLCLNDMQWRHAGTPDFGDRLEADLGYSSLRLRYNSGRHISANGREFAQLMQTLVSVYPVKIKRLTLVGHSMGGLVARSACFYAEQGGQDWVKHLSDIVCLGSPHLGAPLERLGQWVTHSLTATPLTAPLSGLGKIRSAGIKDLRYCYLRDQDWNGQDLDAPGLCRPEPLPPVKHVRYYNIAATLGKAANDPLDRWLGDWLVPVKSATSTVHRSRNMPGCNQDGRVFFGMNHFALMHHPDVYAAIYAWLANKPQRGPRGQASHSN